MKRTCPRCNDELSTNCYVKDKGINTLSYLELIIKKDIALSNIYFSWSVTSIVFSVPLRLITTFTLSPALCE